MNRIKHTWLRLAAGTALATLATKAWACPSIDRLVDFNCDQRLKVSITGDSIVKGVGDDEKHTGGYVKRLINRFKAGTFGNLGVGGTYSGTLYRSYRRLLASAVVGPTKNKLNFADHIVIDVGRNDYFLEEPAAKTVRNIDRLQSLLRNYVRKQSGVTPLVTIVTLLPTTRDYQREFIDDVNRILLASDLPVYLRLDQIDPLTISEDGIHPSPEGYKLIADIFEDYLRDMANQRMISLRNDLDQDDVFDLFETRLFNTDPSLADTDQDGKSDGLELFTTHSDPLVAD